MRQGQHSSGATENAVWWPCLGGALALGAFWAVGVRYFDGWALDLGSLGVPAARHAAALLFWSLFGSFAAGGLALAAARWIETRYGVERFGVEWGAVADRTWILFGSLFAFLVPLGIRTLVLDGAAVTDDETAYRFATRLLASGHLVGPSHPQKLFFDHTFLINDGRVYIAYFLGWPALAVPAVWLGAPGLMNPVYAAATLPALFLAARRLAGSAWAKALVVLYVGAPLLMIGAATELAHTSCLAALAWCFWFLLRTRDADAPLWSHAGLAVTFVVAFFVRPLSALAIGLPLLLAWSWRLVRVERRRAASAVAFLLPVIAGAALFLATNHALTGSVFSTSYDAFARYAEANDYRFVTFDRHQPATWLGMRFDGPVAVLASSAVALLRLNFDLFGWPCSLLFVFFAAGSTARLPLAMLASFAALHVAQVDAGIDSFGPVHLFEAALPLLLLSVIGISRLAARGPRAVALLAALLVTAWLGYVPVRLSGVRRIAAAVNAPRDAVAAAGLENAVVFAPWPYAAACHSAPTRHFVFQRPMNDPFLRDSVLWVNHLSVAADQKLMTDFPDREGFIMRWEEDCRVALLPLAGLAPDAVRDGVVSAQR